MVGDLPQRLERYRIPTLERFAPGAARQPANWKVVAENYLEGYHIPIAHPGLMRMLDYKRYDVEVHEHWVWFEAPMRSKPSSNRLERLYAGLVTPMPGLGRGGPARVALRLHLPQHGDRPLPRPGHDLADRPARSRSHPRRVQLVSPGQLGPRTRAGPTAQPELNNLVLDEDIDLVDNVQQGLQTRGYECGPLSRREDGVAWLADRVRADLAPALGADA